MGGRGSSNGTQGGTSWRIRNNLDFSSTWKDATFPSPQALSATVRTGDDGRFDILDNRGDDYSGSILFVDSYGSDGRAYEVSYQKDYSNGASPRGIRVIDFKEYEDGEW